MDTMHVYDEIIEAASFANKELGQNYLINQQTAKKIVDLLETNKNDDILEVGSGFGALSIFLLDKEYHSLTLNDVDLRATKFLEEIIKEQKHAKIIDKSALKIDISKYNKIISNLPYYLTNDLLEYAITRSNAKKYVFMVQKEVMGRLTARERSADYGPLSILISNVGELKKEFNVSRDDFMPKPHIDSSVFSIIRKCDDSIDRYNYLQFLKRMFLHRRKTIYNNLSLYLMNKDKAKSVLDNLNISILTRPEEISPDIYLKIYKKIN